MTKQITAKITPTTVEKRDTVKGVRYSVMQSCAIETRGKGGKSQTATRTAMAFGRNNAAVANILRPGKTIEVVGHWDGGSFRILGKATAKAA